MTVDVQDLEVSFQGAITLNPDADARPLRSWRLLRSTKGGGTSSSSGSKAAEAAVRAGRTLLEVIAAANAQLESRYERSLAAGLQELCSRLAPVGALGQPPHSSNAISATAAAGGGGGESAQDPSAPSRQPTTAAAAAGGGPGGRVGDADVYTLLSLLRRLQLWPVSVALLKKTGAGKLVGVLQSHPNPQVAQLAKQVVAQWKAAVQAQSNNSTTAAAPSPKAAPGAPAATAAATAAAAVADDQLRAKVRQLLLDAVMHHLSLGKAGSKAGVTAAGVKTAGVTPQQQAAAKQLAQQLEQQMFLLASGAVTPPPPSAAEAAAGSTAAGSTAAPAELKDYKTRARVLAAALRHVDGVAVDLLTGGLTAAAAAALDTRGLAPASVKQQLAEREAKQRADEEAWEALSATLVGGGGTHMSDAKCPRCGAQKAQVHNILSGGTYAQERVPIQKYVCQECSYTWRLDG